MTAKKRPEDKLRMGRPPGSGSTYTAEKAAEILKRIELGTPPTVAAQACGVPLATFDKWKRDHPDFGEAVAQARSEFEARAVESITLAGGADWRALAWSLERQMQAKYAVKIKVVREDEANRLLDVAERVLARQDYIRLVEAIAATDSAGEAGEAASGEPDLH